MPDPNMNPQATVLANLDPHGRDIEEKGSCWRNSGGWIMEAKPPGEIPEGRHGGGIMEEGR